MFERFKNFFSKETGGNGAKEEVKIESREGQVYVATAGGLRPFKKFKIKKSSKQLQEQERWITIENLISKPYHPQHFLQFYEQAPVLAACVNQLAEDVSGVGWRLALKEGEEEDPEEKKEVKSFLEHVNPEESIKQLLGKCMIDYFLLGAMEIEVVRTLGGKICELWHIPDRGIYLHRSKKKYSQFLQNKYCWFTIYEPDSAKRAIISKVTGKKGSYNFEARANELIRLISYNPASSFYGLPPLVSSIASILNLIESAQFHLAFLWDRGIPEYVIFLKGKWSEGSPSKIANFLQTQVKGKHFQSLVLQPPEGGDARFDQLSVDMKSSEFLLELTSISREDIMATYRVPANRLSIFKKGGSLNTSLYAESNKVYWESVVQPNQMIIESKVNQILEGFLGRPSKYIFGIADMDLRTTSEDIKNFKELFGMASVTPNQIRAKLGMPGYGEIGDKYYLAKTYMPLEEVLKITKKLKKREADLDEREIKLIEAMTEFESGFEGVLERSGM